MRAGSLLRRALAFVRREPAEASGPTDLGAARRRWPHLARGWLDPRVPLGGWRTTVELPDVEDVVRAVASASEGRVGEADVAEVLDVLAQTGAEEARAFRFGLPLAFRQVWIGVVPGRAGTARVFLLGDEPLVQEVTERLSVARFTSARKREEYDRLHRFFMAALEWRWTLAPGSAALRAGAGKDFDPARTIASMERILSDPRSPFLEVLRGLRQRTADLLEELRDLDRQEVEAADSHLAGLGAPTLSEMRRRYRVEQS